MAAEKGTISCCADLYRLPIVNYLLGNSLHPGGLALTRKLANELHLGPDDQLLDVACGRGCSAIMLAQVYRCRVTGVDIDPSLLELARADARRYKLDNLATFIEGDATSLPFPSEFFAAVLCECATSLFSDKPAGFKEMARVLRPGGHLALSDVTFRPETLPAPLDSPLARALCIPQGMGPEAYAKLIESTGLVVRTRTDYSRTIAAPLEKAQSLLGLGQIGSAFGLADPQQLNQIAQALESANLLLAQGELGYWAFIAQRP
jgi:SAM-dependent methyltransferase